MSPALRKATLTFLSSLLTLMAAASQHSWTNRYSGLGNYADQANAIALDASGNVYVTGYSRNSSDSTSSDYATIKYSNDGVPLWTNRYDGPSNYIDEAYALAVDADGNAFVTGVSEKNSLSSEYVTIKYSSDGLPLWTNRYSEPGSGNNWAFALAIDNNGHVLVTGTSGSIPRNYATIKYSNAGVALWTNRYRGPGNSSDSASAITTDHSGNVFVTGASYLNGYATIKYSSSGVAMWTNLYKGGVDSEDAHAIVTDGNGNVFVTGASTGSGGSGQDCVTIKYSNDGVPLWTNRYKGPGTTYDSGRAFAVDAGGDIFVTGTSATIKYSNSGIPLWTNRHGSGPSSLWTPAIAMDASGSVFVTGQWYGGANVYDYMTIKYSNHGVPVWTNRFSGSGNLADGARGIAADHNGNVFVTGRSNRDIGGNAPSDYATIKYTPASFQQAAVLTNSKAITGALSFDLVAEPGGQFAIQASSNLVDWAEVREVIIPATRRTNIVEALATSPAQRFFRALRL